MLGQFNRKKVFFTLFMMAVIGLSVCAEVSGELIASNVLVSFGSVNCELVDSLSTIFTDGFENGLSNWSGSQGSASITFDTSNTGVSSLRCTRTFNFVYKDLNYDNLLLDFYIKFGAPLDAGDQIVFGVLMQQPWTWLSSIGLTNTGGAVSWTLGNSGNFSNSNIMTNPSLHTWHHVQLYVQCGSASDGQLKVVVNGVELSDLTQTNITTSFTSISRGSVGMIYCSGWSSSDSIWIDDVALSTISSYTSPSPTPSITPSIAPSPTPISSITELPLTGLGTDYTLHYSDGSVESWIAEGITTKLVQYREMGYTVSRMGFEFGTTTCMSTLNYAKFDRLLEIFDSLSIKIVPVAWDDQTLSSTFLSTYKSNWLTFASRYCGDNRIAAFALFSEPTNKILTHSMNRTQFLYYAADLVRSIHEIDPNRICIFALPVFMYSTFGQWLPELRSCGVIDEPNVVFDIIHPYYFENDWDMEMMPEQKANWYGTNWLAPAVAAFGANRCWAGETFAWVGEKTIATINYPSHNPNPDLQKRWLTAIINEYDKYGVGFSIWSSMSGAKWTIFEDVADEVTYGR